VGDRTQLAVMTALYAMGFVRRLRWVRDYEIGTVAIGGLRAPSGA
jgi:hypothetical protein